MLEDDYDCDIRYEGSHLPPIAALAPDCTIYLGTFSKSLGGGIAHRLHGRSRTISPKRCAVRKMPAQQRHSLARAGDARRLHAHRQLCRASAAAFARTTRKTAIVSCDTLRRNFGDVAVEGDRAGCTFVWHLPPGIPDAVTVEAIALRARVGVYSCRRPPAFMCARQTALTEPRHSARLCRAVAEADREGHRAAVGRHRRCHRRSRHRHDGLFLSDPLLLPRCPIRRATRQRELAPRLRQQPALRRASPPRALSAQITARQGSAPMPVLKNIYRYPIKGLSAQPLARVELEAKKPLPHDRIFALVRPGAPFDTSDPQMGQERTVRHADAGGSIGPGPDHAGCRDACNSRSPRTIISS